MATITAGVTVSSNASTASTPGPLSFALSLAASDTLDVTKVETKILDVKGDHTASIDAGVLWDASDYTASGQAGTDGAFVYIKNTSSTDGHHITIGHGTAANLSTDASTTRLMTLRGGEFAFFPWDCTADIVYDANGDYSAALESWVFVRTGTA
jgi:hypothetical protein|tara:strand:+ start:95 stop:556 length:462 start_codon:yes stop_codon:yes gene_type:complete